MIFDKLFILLFLLLLKNFIFDNLFILLLPLPKYPFVKVGALMGALVKNINMFTFNQIMYTNIIGMFNFEIIFIILSKYSPLA
jgi:hypothetical protein